MENLESVIGYTFRNPELLKEALTHASLARKRTKQNRVSNQRLEFLGDAVLELLLSDALFRQVSDVPEGVLTKWRAQLVSAAALAARAREIHLGRFLEMDSGEESSGGRERDSILADGFEAVIGAVYLDGGLEAAGRLVMQLFEVPFRQVIGGESPTREVNPKGYLQELLQAVNQETPNYELVTSSGPDHARSFEVLVRWNGIELGRGSGRSKKEAEIDAARAALLNPVLDDYTAEEVPSRRF